jgi:hypothetical protein
VEEHPNRVSGAGGRWFESILGHHFYRWFMKKKILKLRPTQVALGLKEVEFKVKSMKKMPTKELATLLDTKIVPIVLSPNNEIFMVDHHHYVRACWELDIDKVSVKSIADFSNKTVQDFWHEMKRKAWVYPRDQYGAPVNPHYHLPDNIKGLADDPYRSIAWMVRERGGFYKVSTPFAEFHWGDFFREHLKHHPRTDGYRVCTEEALILSQEDITQHLPGFRPGEIRSDPK